MGSTRVLVNISPLSDDIAEGNEDVVLTITSIIGAPVGVTGTISTTSAAAAIVIVDDPDDTNVTLSIISFDSTAMEGVSAASEPAVFRISIDDNKEFSRDITVSYVVPQPSAVGNAREVDDYISIGRTRLIAEGSTFIDIEISPVNDNISEGNETVIMQLNTIIGQAAGVTAVASATNRADLTIIDDDTTIIILLEATDSTATEEANLSDPVTDSANFRISIRDGIILSTNLTINYTINGIAINGVDYASIALNATLASGSTVVDIAIVPIGDNIAEGDETFNINLTADSGAPSGVTIILSTNTEQIIIIDEDTNVEISILSADSTANENPTGTAEFTISLNKEIATQTFLTYSISGSAVNGLDYSAIVDSHLFAISSTALATIITPIPANGDGISEGDETVVVTLNSLTGLPAGVTVGIVVPAVTLTIEDNPTELITNVTLQTIDGSIAEAGADTATLRIFLERPVARDLVINYSITGSADLGIDYQILALSVLIPENSTFVDIVITPIGSDNLGEGPETLIVEITTITGQPAQVTLNLVAPNRELLTIVDDPNDAQIDISLLATDPTAGERDTTVGELNPDFGNFRISLDNPAATDIVINYTLSATSSADNGIDYNTIAISVTIPAMSSFSDISISPLDDVVGEGDETIELVLLAASGQPSGVTLTITAPDDQVLIEDDPADLIILVETVALDSSISETGETAGRFNLRINNPLVLDLSITYTLGGTAINNSDYSSIGNTAIIGGNVVVSQATTNVDVIITAIDDLIAGEGNESVSLLLTTASYPNPQINVTVSTAAAVMEVIDNDIEISVQLLSNGAASENGSTASFLISIDNDLRLEAPLTILYSTGGSAINSQDYNLSQINAVIPALSTSTIITVNPVDDIVAGEGDETLTLTLNTVQGAPAALSVVLSTNSPVVTLVDNDTEINIDINTIVSPADENGFIEGQFQIEITDGILVAPLTVGYTILGSAINGLDYIAINSTQVIAPLSSAIDITITPQDDILVEGIETIQLQLLNTSGQPSGLTVIISSAIAAVSLLDEDDQITLQVNSLDATGSEVGSNTATFQIAVVENVQLSQNITIDYTLIGTAINAIDYDNILPPAIITAPSTFINLTITPLDDVFAEGNETILIRLITISGVQQGVMASISSSTDTALITIEDEDINLDVAIIATDGSANEVGPDSGQFQISLSSQLQTDFTLFYSIGGEALNNIDYSLIDSSIVFVSGSTLESINIIPRSDDIGEGLESVSITLSSSSGSPNAVSVAFTSGTAVLDIEDDPSDSQVFVRLIAQDPSAAEANANTGAFLITLDNELSRDLTISYTLTGSATNTDDFETLTTTLLIVAGTTNLTTIITPIEIDNLAEGDATFIDDYIISPFPTLLIPALSSSVNVTITTIDDNLAGEGIETVSLVITSVSGQPAGISFTIDSTSASIDVIDAETNVVGTLTVTDASVAEVGNDRGIFRFTFDNNISFVQDITLNYTLTGTASPADFVGSTLFSSSVINTGLNSIDINFVPVNDGLGEGLENLILTLTTITGAPSSVDIQFQAPISGSFDIEDDPADSILVVTVAEDASAVNEGSSTTAFNIAISTLFNTDLTIHYSVLGTASIGVDYGNVATTILIPVSTTNADIEINLIDDALIERTESIEIQLTSVSGVASAVTTIISTTNAVVEIIDNDKLLSIQVTSQDSTAAEPITAGNLGSNIGTYQITASNPAAFNYILAYSLLGTAGNGLDYSAINNTFIGTTILIPANSTVVNLNINPVGDDIAEGDETLQLILQTATSVIAGVTVNLSSTAAEILLLDEDVFLDFSVSAGDNQASETNDSSTYLVSIDANKTSKQPITVTYNFTGSATNGQDFRLVALSLLLSANQNSTLIEISPIDDFVGEGTESVRINLLSASNAPSGVVLAINTVSADNLITDNDTNLTLASSIIDFLAEEQGPNTGAFRILFTNNALTVLSRDIQVSYTFAGNAINGLDYIVDQGPITIPAGSSGVNLVFTPIDDEVVGEANESVTLILLSTSAAPTGVT
ncbi:uncharacterized protein LOC135830569, partial [Sycon ciliatum]|uniref:uncharacterized protein LOC135830569 n=1 Tax=Sycon ciliatum TaxID=27933 RepID=UPI0031F662FF